MKKIIGFVPEFWEGKTNILVRLWTYAKRGLDIVNDFKYLGAGIFASYYTLKLVNPIWMVMMFVVALPILILIGRWHLFRASKTQEFVTTVKGSVLGYDSFNIQVEILEKLEEINKKLDENSF